jgi:glucose-6-phosphate isomerase, archaeal
MTQVVPEPGLIGLGVDGAMRGATSHYEKRLGDMAGVYRDGEAFEKALAENGPEHLVYRVEEHRNSDGTGALIIGTSTLQPGRYGDEFAMTRGHLHAKADRAELYYCLSGTGVMLLETLSGRTEAYPVRAGEAVHVPGHWVHRSVNVGDEPFVTLFCYGADAGQDYELIRRAGGMRSIVVAEGADGWSTRPNPDHLGYTTG